MKNITFFRGLSLLLILNPLLIFSATENLAPYSVTLKQINSLNLPSTPIDIQLKDGYAYLVCAQGDGGVVVSVNIYDPASVASINSFPAISDKPVAIAFNGSYAYIAQSDGVIKVINFKNRDNPVYTNSIESIGKILKMVVYNGYLYFIRSDFGLNIYDVSLPDYPVLKGVQLVTGEATGLFVKNNYAFVTSSTASMSIIDISQTSKFPIIGNYISGISYYDVYVKDNYAYISQGATGVQVVNVTQLTNPVHVTNIFSRKFAKQVEISGYYTWVNDENTIQAFYNKDPNNQLWAGSFSNGDNSINKIEVDDAKYIYLCSNDNKFKVVQIFYDY